MESTLPNATGEFYPNNIGMPAPGGANDYEMLIVGNNGKGEGQPKVLEVLINHGARLISVMSYLDASRTTFKMAICADLSNLDCSVDSLQIRLRRLKFVNTAHVQHEGHAFQLSSFNAHFA